VKLLALIAAIAPNRKAALGVGAALIAYEIVRAIMLAQFDIALPGAADLLTLLSTIGLHAGV
jgi:hypothetical protein